MESDIRKQVRAQIIELMEAARGRGERPMEAARVAFPGTPIGILAECEYELYEREEESWWQAIERTIDGELIRHALEKGASGG